MANKFNTKLYAKAYAPSLTTRSQTASSSTASRAPTAAPAASCCPPSCATCGLLECLCRPRFFAGQLLSEQDLNRLDAYIRAKNRLHNRQLHGWGVVNGLQVRCDACGNGVVVGTGYAIDPCGEDILVCSDTAVDICALIKQCQPVDVSCVPMAVGGPSPCDAVEEDWVLSIRYQETQTRGVTALVSTPRKSCGCGASANTSCGCGAAGVPAQAPRSTPAACEATAICEGFAFDVCKAPLPSVQDRNPPLSGALLDAIGCCLQPLLGSLPQPPTVGYAANPQAWVQWLAQIRNALLAYLASGPQADCTLLASVQSLVCPSPTDQSFAALMGQAVTTVSGYITQAVYACVCNALLPPAPYGTSDTRVALAIVTVRKSDCKVLRVCNWTSLRRLVLTVPTLEYWLGWIPWLSAIPDQLAGACCGAAPLPAAQAQEKTLGSLIASALARNQPLDPAIVLDGLFGIGPAPQSDRMTSTEQANPAAFLLLDALATRVQILEKALAAIGGTP